MLTNLNGEKVMDQVGFLDVKYCINFYLVSTRSIWIDGSCPETFNFGSLGSSSKRHFSTTSSIPLNGIKKQLNLIP